jgi:translation initiation factor SUI1
MTQAASPRLVSRTTSTFASSVSLHAKKALHSPRAFPAHRFLSISLPTHQNHRARKADNPPTERNGRKTLTTVQGLPKKFDQKKILKVIKKKFACNGTVVADTETESAKSFGEVIQLQGDQRKDVQDFLTDKKEGLGLDLKTIKVHGF